MLGEEIVRTEDPEPLGDRATVDGLRDGKGPEGETVTLRDKLPDNPLRLVSVMLELEDVPAGTDREPGLTEIAKSTTWTRTWTEWVNEPLVAVSVTV